MRVMELREALAKMPGEMNVFLVEGTGVRSAKHIFKANLVGVEQFCELCSYTEQHTPDFEDALIERHTGFKNRVELIEAYVALKSEGRK
ncbi:MULTISPECIES: hypothetical protein [unclassified Phyllobacterium]|uniref:hypothetical protein n=1 Tax=unclassified Phyllobacterium TaxID=2638441 RepID=UPI0030131BDC